MNETPQSSTDIELLDALMELLNASRITAEQMKTALGQHPKLLGPDAQRWLAILEKGQETPEARATVNNLARILGRLQKESPDAVFSDESNRTRRQAARRAREARLRAKREEFLAWRKQPRTGSATELPTRSLPPLAEVEAQLSAISSAERPQVYGRDILKPDVPRDPIPAFLFRGESGAFESTYSSMARLRTSARALEDIVRVRDRVVEALSERCGLTLPQAVGFLQHYGYPTDYLDATSDVSVATSFASWMRVGDVGAMCIIPTEQLLARGSLIDLRNHQLAPRPRLQSAFAVHIPEYQDFKSPAAVEALGLIWINFRFTDLDAARFVPDFALLDARSDEVAGLIWLLIGGCGKFSDEAASLLSKRIDPAPVYAAAGHDGQMVLVSEDDIAPDETISDDAFRRSEYLGWSDAFPLPERMPLPPELERAIEHAEVKPGSVLRLLTSNAIGSVKKYRRDK